MSVSGNQPPNKVVNLMSEPFRNPAASLLVGSAAIGLIPSPL